MRRAGRRDRLVVIERKTVTQDAIGHPVESWATQYSVWCEFLPSSGREILENGRIQNAETARFVTDFYSDVTTADRINVSSKYWNIANIRELGRGEAMEILAEAQQ